MNMDELDFAALVPLAQGRQDYVLGWPSLAEEDGTLEMRALVVMKRQDGVLLALPTGVIPDEELNGSEASLVAHPLLYQFQECRSKMAWRAILVPKPTSFL